MLPYFWYILKVIICSGILFGYYWLFLRNKIFHQYNRFYLLAALALSLSLPILKIDFWQQDSAQQSQVIKALQAVSAGDEYMSNVMITASNDNWNMQQLYTMIYWLVSIIFFLVLLRTLFVIRSLLKKYPVQFIDQFSFVNTDDKSTPFSFLKYIFWNANIDMETTTGKQIFKHEVAHIQERHTYDKLFINTILILFWCNPFFWLYRKELNMIHEFIADKKAVEDCDTAAFAEMILQATYPQHRFQLANNFFYSPIKRRLLMLTKKSNPKISYVARLMVLPLAVLIFAAFSFKARNNNHLYHGKKVTVVIDAGHGGIDPGAISADGILEKDLALSIAKKVKELNSNNAIDIILTRDEDLYMDPRQKVEFTKSKKADLFISIHIDNSVKLNEKSGVSFFVAKDQFANAEKSKVLASSLIDEFTGNYGLQVSPAPQQRNAGIWTLQANDIPAVLVEAGYMTNVKDVAYLQTSDAKKTIAKNVLMAIERYLTQPSFEKNITDTVPTAAHWTQASGANTVEEIDPKKALLVINGKIIGKGTENDAYFNQIHAESITVKWLQRKEGIAKYGKDGTDGACEVSYTGGATIKTAYVDENKVGVFYIGIDNPLVVNAQNVKPEDLVVKISTGKILGINGNYIVKVFQATGVELTLSKRDGTKLPGKFTIMAKLLPDPAKVNLKEYLKGNNTDTIPLKEKLIIEERLKQDITDAEKELRLKSLNNLNEKIVPGQQIETKKLLELKQHALQLDLSRIQFEQAKSELMLNTTGNLKEEAILANKLKGQNLLKEKIALQQSKTNFTQAEKEILEKQSANLKALTVIGTQLEGQELLKAKQNLQLIELNQLKLTEAEKALLSRNKQALLAQTMLGQKELLKENNKVFSIAEVSPRFTGGEDAWKKYLRENIKPGTPVDEGWSEGTYVVIVKFIVLTDGSVIDVTTENYKGTKTALHCIEVIKNAPKWQPAIQNGRKVNAYKKQAITFFIEEQK